MHTIIAGSRSLHDRQDPSDATLVPLVAAAVSAAAWPITLVITGMAVGPDRAAQHWAAAQGIPVQEMRPEWRPGGRYDRGAGLQRNTAMAAVAQALIALHDGTSTGTADMIRKALRRGLAVCVVQIRPTPRRILAVEYTPPTVRDV